MGAGELKGKVDGSWNDFWSAGAVSSFEVIEQITYPMVHR